MARERLIKLGIAALGLNAAGWAAVLLADRERGKLRQIAWQRRYDREREEEARGMLQALESNGLTGELPIVDVTLDSGNETRGRGDVYRALKITWRVSSDTDLPDLTSRIDLDKAMICLHPDPISPTMFLEFDATTLSVGRILFDGFEDGKFDSVVTNASVVNLNLGPAQFNRLRQSQSSIDPLFTQTS